MSGATTHSESSWLRVGADILWKLCLAIGAICAIAFLACIGVGIGVGCWVIYSLVSL